MTTRRSFIQAGTLALCSARMQAYRRDSRAGEDVGRLLSQSPFIVPRKFLGMHCNQWPVLDPISHLPASYSDPAPAYTFGSVRSHDYGVSWGLVHKGPGNFYWDRLDKWCSVHAAAQRNLTYTFSETPAWSSTSPQRLWGKRALGASAAPRNGRDLADFVTAMLFRYNREKRTPIKFVEIWNEPMFEPSLQSDNSFWWGTAQQLAAMGKIIYKACKAVDPSVQVLTPGFTGLIQDLSATERQLQSMPIFQYLSASDGDGGRGADWCDGVAIHPYNTVASTASTGIEGALGCVKRVCQSLGISKPIYSTEIGYTHQSDPACVECYEFGQATLQQKGSFLLRNAITQAALGVQAVYFYAHENDMIGNPSRNVEIVRALQQISLLAGMNLDGVWSLPDGTIQVRSKGKSLVF